MAAFPNAGALRASTYAILNQTPYQEIETKMVDGKRICKYLYDNSAGSLHNAVAAVRRLLRAHPNLVPTFPEDPRSLAREVSENSYLIINGRAVCLAPAEMAPAEARQEFKDLEFSENLIETPIQCSRGHYLELHRFGFWMERAGTRCPNGEDHDISLPLLVNERLRNEIRMFVVSLREVKNRIVAIERRNEAIAREQAAQREEMQRISQVDGVAVSGAMTKIILKTGGKKICVTLVGKTAGKSVAKLIPGISLVAGVSLGAYRLKGAKELDKKALLLAGGEVLSGALAMVPVYGTAASIAIDLALFGVDVHEPVQVWWAGNEGMEIEDPQHNDPYEIFSVDVSEDFSSEQEDASYKGEICVFNPDPMKKDWPAEGLNTMTGLFSLCGQPR